MKHILLVEDDVGIAGNLTAIARDTVIRKTQNKLE